jgi:excisionase family DNA binding protein
MTAKLVAERLMLSELKVRQLIKSGSLPCVRLGRSVPVRASDVDAMVRHGLHRAPQRQASTRANDSLNEIGRTP